MYPRVAGVPTISPSARSTSAEPAVSAGRTTTSTPSSSSVRAPLATASNISCSAGDGVWCTISKVAMAGLLRPALFPLGHRVQRRSTFGRGGLDRAQRLQRIPAQRRPGVGPLLAPRDGVCLQLGTELLDVRP